MQDEGEVIDVDKREDGAPKQIEIEIVDMNEDDDGDCDNNNNNNEQSLIVNDVDLETLKEEAVMDELN